MKGKQIKSGNKIKNKLQVLNITGGSNDVKFGKENCMVTKRTTKGVKNRWVSNDLFLMCQDYMLLSKNTCNYKRFKYLKHSSVKLSANQ